MSVNASLERILEQLELASKEMPEWAEVLDLQIAVLEAQIAADVPAVSAKMSATEATQRRQQGLSLIGSHELALEWDVFTTLFRQVCQIGIDHRKDLGEAFEYLQKMPADEPDELENWVKQFMVDTSAAKTADLGLKLFVLTHTLRPFLRRYAEAYDALVDEQGWRRGYCPICGGEPDFAAFSAKDEDSEGARRLLCSRCDNEWVYRRVGCPFCENTDHSKLEYFPEKKGPHRLYVCKACQRYLKTIDLRGAPGQVLLPVERVLSLHMEVAAKDEGYQ